MARRRGYHSAILVLGTGALLLFGVLSLWLSSIRLPDLREVGQRKIIESTKIYDRSGTVLLYDLHDSVRRTVVPYEALSIHLRNATVAIEDSEFYNHRGIRPKAILRAVLANLGAGGFSQGGSTITQQVVKNSILTSEKRITRKLKEWVLALKLEKILGKQEILTLYLNESPYGGNVYGAEEASRMYFGKSAADLSIVESAYLASLPNAPTYYSPYGNNRDKLEERKNFVLYRMNELGFISGEEYDRSANEKVSFKPPEGVGLLAPHFVLYVKEILEEKYGERAVSERGFRIITTLDASLQRTAEDIVKKYALQNEKTFNAENAALVAIDPKTGHILAMVGSRDYFDTTIDGNFNVALAERQPGSAFKPFAYAAAFLKGFTPDTALFDVPTEFSVECKPDGTPYVPGNDDRCYHPENYDGVFRGPMTMRTALAQSINVPSVKTLYLAGLSETLKLAKAMGVESLGSAAEYGLTLVLGGGEVSLLELTGAYGALANGGVRNPPTPIIRVEDRDGNTLESFTAAGIPVLPEEVALILSDILSDSEARGPSFGGTASPLYFGGRKVAAKTGTTNDFKDAWVVGYTPTLAVGAWAGNNDNTPMEKKVAGFIVAPLWRAFMDVALPSLSDEPFKPPPEEDQTSLPPVLRGFWQGGLPYMVDKISGKLATPHTPPEVREERVVREVHTILYWVDKLNPRMGKNPAAESDPQFELWEYAVREWAKRSGVIDETTAVIPRESDTVHLPEFAPVITVVTPAAGSSVSRSGTVRLEVLLSGKFPAQRIEVFFAGRFVGSILNAPWRISFPVAPYTEREGMYELSISAFDSVLNTSRVSVPLSITL